MISTHHGVTFHALRVSSWAFDFDLNFDLAHCALGRGESKSGVSPDWSIPRLEVPRQRVPRPGVPKGTGGLCLGCPKARET